MNKHLIANQLRKISFMLLASVSESEPSIEELNEELYEVQNAETVDFPEHNIRVKKIYLIAKNQETEEKHPLAFIQIDSGNSMNFHTLYSSNKEQSKGFFYRHRFQRRKCLMKKFTNEEWGKSLKWIEELFGEKGINRQVQQEIRRRSIQSKYSEGEEFSEVLTLEDTQLKCMIFKDSEGNIYKCRYSSSPRVSERYRKFYDSVQYGKSSNVEGIITSVSPSGKIFEFKLKEPEI